MKENAQAPRRCGERVCRNFPAFLLAVSLLLSSGSMVAAQGGDITDSSAPVPLSASWVEATEGWDSITTWLPYAAGAFTGAPHQSNNMSQLSGLDFSSSNGTVLNVADGWLVSRDKRKDWSGNYVVIQIDGTDLQIEYWHLSEISQKLRELKVGSFVPRGFPIGRQGGTSDLYCTEFLKPYAKCEPGQPDDEKLRLCKARYGYFRSVGKDSECLFAPHIHVELKNFASPGQRATSSTWDSRKLDNWSFFVDTTDDGRTIPIQYQGTAVTYGTAIETKKMESGPETNKLTWYRVTGKPETAENTKVAISPLGSNGVERDCTMVTCENPAEPRIVAPTDKAKLQVGPHAAPLPKAGPIKVEVDKQFTDLKAADFKVLIGGKEAQVQVAARTAGKYSVYELFVAPPSQPMDGQYDLVVQVNGQSATSAKSVMYGDQIGVSYVLLLDTSRSMNCALNNPANDCSTLELGAKIAEAKLTAENFVQLLASAAPQESAGLVHFNGYSGIDNRNGTPKPATQAHKEHLSDVIRGLEASGGTPLYDALEAAAADFAGNSSPTKVVLLLSDGMQNAGSSDLDRAIRTAKDAGVQVCSVRFGSAAVNLDILNRISRETGCAAAQSALEPGQLGQTFGAIRLEAAGHQAVRTFTGVAQPGLAQEFELSLDRLSQATFQVELQSAVSSAELRFELVSPDGLRYTPDQLNGAELITSLTLKAFRIPNPLAGLWRMIVGLGGWSGSSSPSAAALPATGVPFEVGVTGESSLWLRSYAEGPVKTGNLLELGASLASTEPITGAVTTVTVERPSGSKVVVPLLDDGAHADGFLDDGYYGAAFNDTFEAGTYRLEYNSEGQLPDGTAFTRLARREVQMDGSAGSAVLQVPLAEGLNLFGLNGLAPVERDPRRALISVSDAYTMVLSYNPADGGLGFYTHLPDSVNTLREMDPYQGYWIRATRPITLEVKGPTMQQDAYVPLHFGWNLVPFLSSGSLPVPEALSSIEGKYTGVRGYKNGAMSYWPQLPESMNTLEVMEPNLAYWVEITDVHALLEYPAILAGQPIEAEMNAAPQEVLAATNKPQAPHGVIPTEEWIDLYSFDVMVNEKPAPVGSLVTVYSPNGRKVGESVVQTAGWVGILSVYGASRFSGGEDGPRPGDILSFEINGKPAAASDMDGKPITWTVDGDLLQVRLAVSDSSTDKVLLPLLMRDRY